MSGHSKWSNIKRTKAVQDAKRSNAFTKLSRLITVAVRTGGGPDPDGNFKLRLAIETARANSLPKDTIERAIQRGLGVGGEMVEEIVYEGFGPGGVALMIETATDNRNRTVNDIKKTLSDAGGSLGSAGSTGWMFEQRGRVIVPKALSEDEQLIAMDLGATDIDIQDGKTLIETSVDRFTDVQRWISDAVGDVEANLVFVPKSLVPVPDGDALDVCVADLEALDDVQRVFHNGEYA